MDQSEIIKHILDREYMSGIERDKSRVKKTGEVFTRNWTVELVLDQLERTDPTAFIDKNKTFMDPAVGDGALLGAVLIRKLKNGIEFEQALKTCYGVDLMKDNVELCRSRLLAKHEHLRHIVEKNIVVANSLSFHFRMDGTPPDPEDVVRIAPGVGNLFENWYEDQK